MNNNVERKEKLHETIDYMNKHGPQMNMLKNRSIDKENYSKRNRKGFL